jgi:hypothetical protein
MAGSAHELLDNDLQYITQCVAGSLFGGWYRVLHDGRIELLALGGIWRSPGKGSLPQRQARAMLARLVRLRGAHAETKSAYPKSAYF